MSMADYGPRLVVATDQQASASEVAATVLVSPYYAVSDADMSKALVPRAPMPAAHPRDCDVVAHNAQSLVPSDGTGRSVARLEREGEAGNQSVDITVQGTQVQVGKRVYGNYRAKVEVTGERKRVHQEIELTDDGTLLLRQYTLYERYTYRRVIEVMYAAALKEPEEEKETKKEKCIDFCCLACICNLKELFGKSGGKIVKTKDIMTPSLRRGRSKGWLMQSEIIFPFISDTVREVLVSFELITVLIAFALSAATFTSGKNEVFNILHLALTIVGTVLAVTDAVFSLSGCKICKGCIACCCPKEGRGEHGEKNGADKVELLSDSEGEERGNREAGGCRKCLNTTKTKLDFVRMIFTEVLLYPLLICDIFELITGQPYKFQSVIDGLSVVLFGISTVSLVLYVYIVRLAILAGVIFYTHKERRPKKSQQQRHGTLAFDYSISKSALYFQGYFFYHVLMQMIAQILMIVAISFKIEYENRHLFNSTSMTMNMENTANGNSTDMNMDGSIRVSMSLWYILVGGYILPILGFFTFFIVTYFWVQQFPIGLCIDLLSLLQMPGMENITNFRESTKESKGKMDKILHFIGINDLKRDFSDLRKRSWFFDKFAYPFQNPVLVILCMCYTALQFAFVVFAFPEEIGIWALVYVISVFLGGVANMYVFVVTFLWSILAFGVITASPWILLFFIFIYVPYTLCTKLNYALNSW